MDQKTVSSSRCSSRGYSFQIQTKTNTPLSETPKQPRNSVFTFSVFIRISFAILRHEFCTELILMWLESKAHRDTETHRQERMLSLWGIHRPRLFLRQPTLYIAAMDLDGLEFIDMQRGTVRNRNWKTQLGIYNQKHAATLERTHNSLFRSVQV